jgi:DNA mismatch repair protein MutS2
VKRIIRRLRQGRDGAEVSSAALGETARQAGQRLKSLEQQHRPVRLT